MGGSFVREGLQIPVSFLKKEEISDISQPEFLNGCVVPIAFESFLNMVKSIRSAMGRDMRFIEREKAKNSSKASRSTLKIVLKRWKS